MWGTADPSLLETETKNNNLKTETSYVLSFHHSNMYFWICPEIVQSTSHDQHQFISTLSRSYKWFPGINLFPTESAAILNQGITHTGQEMQ
jgi:hypothetical protein